ncbi:hypothetical protein TKK_0000746 [Trichogramma kaykai]
MESSGTFSYATKVKEESIDMSYIESYNGETKCHTSDTENVQYLSFLQENTIHTRKEHEGIDEFPPNRDIKIEFECKDVKPDWNILVSDKLNKGICFKFDTNYEMKEEFEGKIEFRSDTIESIDLNTGGKLNGPKMIMCPLGKFKGTSGAVGNVGLVDLRKYAARFGLKDRSFPSERDWMARLR